MIKLGMSPAVCFGKLITSHYQNRIRSIYEAMGTVASYSMHCSCVRVCLCEPIQFGLERNEFICANCSS